MNISHYEVLIAAIENGTMTKAAEELGYTQSGLTRALNSLEQQWNVRLLNRGRSGVKLTSEGQLLLPYIRKVLHDQQMLSERVNELNGLKEGMIRVGTFNSVSAQWLPGIIKKFHADYPGIQFELLHGTDEQIVNWIEEGRVDVGFVAYPTKPGIESQFLYRDPIVSIFASDDPHTSKKVFPISELEKIPYIALNEGVDDEITAILVQNRIQPNTCFVESDDHAVVAMVEQGLGTSLIPEMMLNGFDRKITAIPLEPPGYRDLGIACSNKGLLSVAALEFFNYACDWVRENYVI